MSLRGIGVVYRKELIDSLRDRRTLFSMIAVPLLLMPVLTIGLLVVLIRQVGQASEEVPKVMVLGGKDSPKVRAAARLWGRQWVAIEQRILAQYLATEAKEPGVWQKASTFFSFEAYVTPDELIKLGERFTAMVDRYSARAESKRPAGARPVHLALTAFPRPEDPALRRKAAVRQKERRGRTK